MILNKENKVRNKMPAPIILAPFTFLYIADIVIIAASIKTNTIIDIDKRKPAVPFMIMTNGASAQATVTILNLVFLALNKLFANPLKEMLPTANTMKPINEFNISV